MRALKRMKKTISRKYFALMAMATTAIMSSPAAMAGGTELKDVIARGGGQFSDAGKWVQTVFGVGGFVLVGLGIWGLATRKDNPQKPISHSIWFIVGGAFLLILTVILQMVTSSTFGTSSTSLDRIGL